MSLLLVKLESCSLPVTFTLLVTLPVMLILAVILILIDSPLAKSPIYQTPVALS